MIPPIGESSKKPKAGSPLSTRIPCAKIFAGVPIKVISPPNREEKASGMSSLDAGILVFIEIPITAGINTATAPTLFIKADMMPHTNIIIAISRASCAPDRRKISDPNLSATPVLKSPPDTIYTAQMVITAELAKPKNISSLGTMPTIATSNKTIKAIKSTRSFSVANKTNAIRIIPNVRPISSVIIYILSPGVVVIVKLTTQTMTNTFYHPPSKFCLWLEFSTIFCIRSNHF